MTLRLCTLQARMRLTALSSGNGYQRRSTLQDDDIRIHAVAWRPFCVKNDIKRRRTFNWRVIGICGVKVNKTGDIVVSPFYIAVQSAEVIPLEINPRAVVVHCAAANATLRKAEYIAFAGLFGAYGLILADPSGWLAIGSAFCLDREIRAEATLERVLFWPSNLRVIIDAIAIFRSRAIGR